MLKTWKRDLGAGIFKSRIRMSNNPAKLDLIFKPKITKTNYHLYYKLYYITPEFDLRVMSRCKINIIYLFLSYFRVTLSLAQAYSGFQGVAKVV